MAMASRSIPEAAAAQFLQANQTQTRRPTLMWKCPHTPQISSPGSRQKLQGASNKWCPAARAPSEPHEARRRDTQALCSTCACAATPCQRRRHRTSGRHRRCHPASLPSARTASPWRLPPAFHASNTHRAWHCRRAGRQQLRIRRWRQWRRACGLSATSTACSAAEQRVHCIATRIWKCATRGVASS